jgi:hypothetical protein
VEGKEEEDGRREQWSEDQRSEIRGLEGGAQGIRGGRDRDRRSRGTRDVYTT